jgi:predicted transcriptional regulator
MEGSNEQKRIQAEVPAELARQVRVLAANRDVTVPSIVKEALEQYLARSATDEGEKA